ncbi:hypothetical protein [Algoriphagus halophilus]|uniref:Cytochrome c domain-containing protein n=1 Tax=Algoriphagus halophilus TaxID=226505 RepID=A0A1N6DV64_9BACT|nr:hypothetical protein [Algoriphagus halophilus]SIN74669.1 hypothetical protein SAMN05444394_1428 [Algoriphagus halophilus]
MHTINFMKRGKVWIGFSLMLFIVQSCSVSTNSNTEGNDAAKFVNNNFPDFGKMLSPEEFLTQYPGEKVFELSQDYPLTMPDESQLPEFLNIPFDEDEHWMEYINAVRDYSFEGMIEVDFVAQKSKVRNWYHMPWMHWGPQGSEGFHGLAKEAEVGPYQLGPNQTESHQTYALGFYNEFAGYTLAQMWKDGDNPNAYATQAPNGFPVGTVIFKLLFTDADETDADYLVNPMTWNAYITPTWNNGLDTGRIVKPMHLIQMDVMVRDPRADQYGTGWVFGTFCYNGKLNNGKEGSMRAENLVPVGIQFGNDPQDTTNFINPYPVKRTIINPNLKQTKINPDSTQLPPQHLGWGGRLDGPVDLNTSSCMSCHATAEFPQVAPLVPKEAFIGDTNAMGQLTKLTETQAEAFRKYFQNLRCATPYTDNATSCDFSLQVSLALGYFTEWKDEDVAGYWTSEYERLPVMMNRDGSPKVEPNEPQQP